MAKKKNYFLLIYIVVCATVAILFAVFSTLFFISSSSTLNESVTSRLISNVEAASLLITDGNGLIEHQSVVDTYSEKGLEYSELGIVEEYEELLETGKSEEEAKLIITNKYKEAISYNDTIFADNSFASLNDKISKLSNDILADGIYTLCFNENKDILFFVLDTDEAINPNSPNYVFPAFSVGDIYLVKGEDDNFDFFAQVLNESENTYGDVYTGKLQDDFGNFMTGFKGLYDSNNNLYGVVAVDIVDDSVERHQNAFILSVVGLEIILLVIFGLSGVLVYRLQKSNDKMQLEIEKMAYYDSLTKLPNRISLFGKLEELVDVDNTNIYVLFIDLDNFKIVNDNEGHLKGDTVLQEVSDFLLNAIYDLGSKDDFVSRLGGDEFIVVYNESKHSIEEYLNKLFSKFDEFSRKKELIHKYNVSLSIGVSKYQKGMKLEDLINHADEAMYKAKTGGKNKYFLDK